MKIGLIFQSEAISWQKHLEIYTRTEKRIANIEMVLKKQGYEVRTWTSIEKFLEDYNNNRFIIDILYHSIEACFNRNTNGFFPTLLEINNIPYIGNDPYINTITSDKKLLNDLVNKLNIVTPSHFIITKLLWETDKSPIVARIIFPCVLKYRYGTMSFQTKKIDNINMFYKHINMMLEGDNGPILCEEYIEGFEITVPMIGNAPNEEVLAIIEYTNQLGEPIEIYDTIWKGVKDKYIKLKLLDSSSQVYKYIARICHILYEYLDFHDYARFDFRISNDNIPYLLEANPLPALNYDSAFDPQSYGLDGSFEDVLNKIIDSALFRYGQARK